MDHFSPSIRYIFPSGWNEETITLPFNLRHILVPGVTGVSSHQRKDRSPDPSAMSIKNQELLDIHYQGQALGIQGSKNNRSQYVSFFS
jgi:hypothetical protein